MKFTFAPESRPLEGFTIKRAIYRGGFGEVYYGLSDAGREVALKLLQNNTDIELRGVQQCLNLSHPNLVTIFDVRQDGDGDHWIVMEYIAGETLEAAIHRNPNGMPVEVVRKWLPGLIAGTSYLHSRGIVHRDLKPGNIFMEDGVVKIGDVGLSKFITPSRRSAQTQSVGTVYYMAPEVAKGRYGKEVDVYALGVIFYEMLTGTVPFEGESTGEILMKHLTEKPDLEKLPPRLRAVIGKALLKEPEQRYRSLVAFQSDFENAIVGRSEAPFVAAANAAAQANAKEEPISAELDPFAFEQGNAAQTTSATFASGASPSTKKAASEGEKSDFGLWMLAAFCLVMMGVPFWPLVFAGVLLAILNQQHGPISTWIQSKFSGVSQVFGDAAASSPVDPRRTIPTALFLLGMAIIVPWLMVGVVETANGSSRLTFLGIVLLGVILALTIASGLKFLGQLNRHSNPGSTDRPAEGPGRTRPVPPRHATYPQVRPAAAMPTLRNQQPKVRSSAILGGLFAAVPLTLLLVGIVVSLVPSMFRLPSEQLDPASIGFFGLASLVGVWIAGLTSGLRRLGGDWLTSRLVMALLGGAFGAGAFFLSQYLLVDLPAYGLVASDASMIHHLGEHSLTTPEQGPTLAGFMAYFAAMFGLLNWSKLTDPTRSHRFRIWRVCAAVFLAWFATLIVPFPASLAMALVAVIACVTQLSNPWVGQPKKDVRTACAIRHC